MKHIILIFFLAFFFCLSSSMAAASGINERYYKVIYNDIARTNPGLGAEWTEWTAKAILYYSAKWRLNPLLAAANFKQESSYSMKAYSSTGAIGIAQLMPDTAKALGVNPYDPGQNIEGGIRYLAQNMNTFQNAGKWQASYAVAAYNAGPDAIKKHGGIPPYQETVNHVAVVGRNYNQLCQEFERIE